MTECEKMQRWLVRRPARAGLIESARGGSDWACRHRTEGESGEKEGGRGHPFLELATHG